MTRNDFSILLQKYLDDRCSETEQRMVESWFALLDDEKRWQNMPKEEILAVEQRLWNRLQQSMHAETSPASLVTNDSPAPVKKLFRLPAALRVAASLLIVVLGAALVFQLSKNKKADVEAASDSWVSKTNRSNKPVRLVLEDGSSLQLSAGTSVRYPAHFESGKRELQLEGNAFFEIAKDSSRPFYVQSNDIVTRVLGTSFWILYNKAQQQSAVEVVTGKVAVYKQGADVKEGNEGVVLKPNEKVIFNKKEEVLITTLVDAPIPLKADSMQAAAPGKAFVYEETPLAQVVQDMESEYGISIILGDEKLSTLQFTGNLSTLDYYTKLNTICRSLATAYEVKGNRILIQKK